jgi:hypothetical protein
VGFIPEVVTNVSLLEVFVLKYSLMVANWNAGVVRSMSDLLPGATLN